MWPTRPEPDGLGFSFSFILFENQNFPIDKESEVFCISTLKRSPRPFRPPAVRAMCKQSWATPPNFVRLVRELGNRFGDCRLRVRQKGFDICQSLCDLTPLYFKVSAKTARVTSCLLCHIWRKDSRHLL